MKNYKKFLSSLKHGDIVQSVEKNFHGYITRYLIALNHNGKLNLFYGKWYGNNPLKIKSYGKIHDISGWNGEYSEEQGYRDIFMYRIGNVKSFPLHKVEKLLGEYQKGH